VDRLGGHCFRITKRGHGPLHGFGEFARRDAAGNANEGIVGNEGIFGKRRCAGQIARSTAPAAVAFGAG